MDQIINLDDTVTDKEKLLTREFLKIVNSRLDSMTNSNMKKNTITEITLYACFLKIGEIENVKQRFQAETYIEAQWEDNTVVESTFDPKKYWVPDLFIENTVGSPKQDIKYKLIKKDGKTFVVEMRKATGTFYETLELNDFPVDKQDISITVTTTRSEDEIKFILSTENESNVNTEDFRMQQEWKLFGFVNTSRKEFRDIFRKYNRPAFSFSGQTSRRPGYFLNNAYLLMFLISALGLMPFSFAISAASTRVATTVTLILSSINFKIAVTTRLPTVSYLTILDWYALPALFYLGALCAYHGIISSTLFSSFSRSDISDADKIAFYIFSGLYVSYHFFYFILFLYKFLKNYNLKKDEEEEEDDKKEAKKDNILEMDKMDKRPISRNAILPAIIKEK